MELAGLPNIGPELERLLHQAGIRDAGQLRELGAEQVFLRLKAQDPTACFHKLTAIEGAVQGVRKSRLTPERKAELKAWFQQL